MALLPDREQSTAQAWLAERPSIKVVARDRGGGYGEAVARALPQAVQSLSSRKRGSPTAGT